MSTNLSRRSDASPLVVLNNYARTEPDHISQIVAPGDALRFSDVSGITRRASLSSDGSSLTLQDSDYYQITFQLAPNNNADYMSFNLKIGGALLLPPAGSRQWLYSVAYINHGDDVSVVNAGTTPFTVDTGTGSVYLSIMRC